jgi:hypothetical protein
VGIERCLIRYSVVVQKTGVLDLSDIEKRDVEKVLQLRYDISPFLVHLTRDIGHSAKYNLGSILKSMTLRYGTKPISDASYKVEFYGLDMKTRLTYFSAVSFTEAPLSEIHNLLEIKGRQMDLQPYGLVFLKKRLMRKGVSPVFYINNMMGNKDKTVEALCSLMKTHAKEAAGILPFVSFFGKFLKSVYGGTPSRNKDFMWEREWRYSSRKFCFTFEKSDVFIGLCPDRQIGDFESRFQWLRFIDPRRNMKWYAEKLIEARKRARLKQIAI